jgi:hypothetical protein
VVILLGRALASWLLAIDERGRHGGLCGSGRWSVITCVHGRTELYCSSLPCLCEPEPFSIDLSTLDEVASTRLFYSSRSGSYNKS